MTKDIKTTKTKNTKTTKAKFTTLQVAGLWVLIIGSGLFWGGVAVGTQATLNSQAQEAQVKAQAVEEYKATQVELKAEQ